MIFLYFPKISMDFPTNWHLHGRAFRTALPFHWPRCGGHPGVHLAVGGAQGEGRQVATDGDLHLRAGGAAEAEGRAGSEGMVMWISWEHDDRKMGTWLGNWRFELDGDWMGKILQKYSSQMKNGWGKFGDRKALISGKFWWQNKSKNLTVNCRASMILLENPTVNWSEHLLEHLGTIKIWESLHSGKLT